MSEPINCSTSELCIFLQALEEGFLPIFYSDTNQSAQLKSMDTASKSYQQGKKTVAFPGFQFSMMLQHSMVANGKDSLISSRVASLAPTYHQQEQTAETMGSSEVLTENIVDCGRTRQESYARWSQSKYSWKTPQCSLIEDSTEYCGIWPRWGSMRNGACYQRVNAAHLTNVSACGLWLPTPTAHNAKEGNYPAERTRNTPTLAAVLGGKINPEYQEWMMGFPIGHTDLRPVEMHNRQSWLQQHGKFLTDES